MHSIANPSARAWLASPLMATLLCWSLLVCPALGLAANIPPPHTETQSTHQPDCPFATHEAMQGTEDDCYPCQAAEQIPVELEQSAHQPANIPHGNALPAHSEQAQPDHTIQPRHDPPLFLMNQVFLI